MAFLNTSRFQLDKLLCELSILSALFPYFRLQTSSYTQLYPYLLALAYLLSLSINDRKLYIKCIKMTRMTLPLLSVPFILVVFAATQDSDQSLKYLISLLGPIFLTPIYLSALIKYHKQTFNLVFLALILWALLGLFQLAGFQPDLFIVSPEVQSDMALSGRGSVSFSPEPTHFGFTMICMSSILICIEPRQTKILIILITLASSILVAKSSSCILIYLLAFFSCVATFAIQILRVLQSNTKNLLKIRIRVLFLALMFLASILGLYFFANRFLEGSRIVDLISQFKSASIKLNPDIDSLIYSIQLIDFSVGARLGGLLFSLKQVFLSYGLPNGFSNEHWNIIIQSSGIDISAAGPPSGYFLNLYVGGVLALPVLSSFFSYLTNRIDFRQSLISFILLSSGYVFLFQFTLASPVFSLLLSALVPITNLSNNYPKTAEPLSI